MAYFTNPLVVYSFLKHYKMWTKSKGQALVVNIRNFTKDLPSRTGSEIDTMNIVHLLKELGYKVEQRHDLTAKVRF